jgi:hypothetical protein
MRRNRAAALAVLLAPIVAGAATQITLGDPPAAQRTVARDSTGCLDTLRASDSVSAVVKMSVEPQNKKTKLPADFEGMFAQEFKSRFKTPSSLPLSVMRGSAPCDTVQDTCASGLMVLGSRAYAFAHSDGSLSRIGVVDLSLTPVFADSVRSVLLKLSNEHLIPFFASPESIPIEILIGVEQHADTVPRERQLFRVVIPRYRLQFTQPVHSKIERPRYPRNAVAAGVGDTLVFTFTILPNGRVAPGSVDYHGGHYRDFVRPVLESIERSIFTPARIGECRVATWVSQQFVFAMRNR